VLDRLEAADRTAELVNELAETADERQLTKVLARYSRVGLLCLDELGYLELDKAGAKLLFQIFTDREERRAMAVASNAPFSEWKHTFTDPRLCAAIVDRLTYNAHIIETGSQSFRLAQASRAHASHYCQTNKKPHFHVAACWHCAARRGFPRPMTAVSAMT
jgi:DNA replication protein DnaC